jgi:hypothetical protein
MSLVNYSTRELTAKVVYYGPGRSGKTSNLQYVHAFQNTAATTTTTRIAQRPPVWMNDSIHQL